MSSCCRQLHSPTNLIVLSLAVSDFIMGFLVMPMEIVMMWTCWVLGDLMCSLYFLLPITVVSATIGNITLISIDRFVAICDPLHYPTRITERTITIVIIILYTRVFIVAVSQARAMRSHVAAKLQVSGTQMINKSELKAARTLGSNIMIGSAIEAFLSFLIFSNSGLNPLIYALFYPWFRKAMKHIVTLQILKPGSREANMLQLHSPTNLIVLSLAVSDFIMGFLVMPIEIVMMWTCWVLGDLMCSLYFLLPMTVISATARAMRSHVAAKLQVSGTRMINKSELKAARTLGSSIMIGSAFEAFLSFLMFSNSGLNPLIYALFYPWFRKAMKHIVTLQILKPGSREANML
ncbi:trace amine-associated receptor 7a-like [Mastacembelus armatus]|uniref:trace amine-associated receptor 7a-like n=1 Tax=Mastacembelus armatus TaxID=205130 RepID=UPI000E45FEC5|nr:trace amine-associated receptor 7a-like [Mastacembelus armatus]